MEEQGGGRVFCVVAQKASHELLFKPSPHSTEKIRLKTNSKPFSNRQGRRTTHASKQPACKNQMVGLAAALVSSWKADWEVRHCLALQNFGSINPQVTDSPSQSRSVAAFRGGSAGRYREAAQQEGSSPDSRLLSGIEDPNLSSGNSSTCETKLAGSSGCGQSC